MARGFTLIELLIVIAILATLAGAIVVAVNPGEQLAGARNDQREVHLDSIWHAVEKKINLDRGWIDCDEIPHAPTPISSDEFDLYDCIYPRYLTEPVHDPQNGFYNDEDDYDSAYYIARDEQGHIFLRADGEGRSIAVGSAPTISVRTNDASDVGQSSATLQGQVLNLGEHDSLEAWFEWSENPELLDANTTDPETVTDPTSFNSSLSVLSGDTTYYFRAIAETHSGDETDSGSILEFTTDDSETVSHQPPDPVTLSPLTYEESGQLSWSVVDTAEDYRIKVYVNGGEVLDDTLSDSAYTIDSSIFAVGDEVYGEVRAEGTEDYLASDYQPSDTEIVDKAPQDPPVAPTLDNRTDSSIALESILNGEYRMNLGSWQGDPEFTGLNPDTTYSFEQRYAETSHYHASSASPSADIATDPPPASFGDWENTVFGGESFESVAYDESGFVLAGGNGTVIRSSSDLTSWDNMSPGGEQLRSVAFGNGTYVGVGNWGTILATDNGSDWEDYSSGSHWRDVTYGGGKFIAVGDTGSGGSDNIRVSEDGHSWTSVAVSNSLKGVAHGNGIFVAVGSTGSIYMSEDGDAWQNHSVGGGTLYDVTFGNGYFVAVGLRGAIYVSNDGINWTSSSVAGHKTTWYLFDVTYGNGHFVASGTDGVVWRSSDSTPTSWNEETFLTPEKNIHSVTFGAGLFVAVGQDSAIYHSTDGSEWSDSSLGDDLTSVTYGDGQFVATGYNGTIVTSNNGESWADVSAGSDHYYSIAYGGNVFAAGSYGSIWSSFDGNNWQESFSGGSALIEGITYGGNGFVAVDSQSILRSSDGLNWSDVTPEDQFYYPIHDVEYGNGNYVAIGGGYFSGYFALVSDDGSNWQEADLSDFSLSYHESSVTYGDGRFLIAGNSGVILESEDGLEWSVLHEAGEVSSGISDIAFLDEGFMILGDENITLWSQDGSDWESEVLPPNQVLQGVSYGNGRIVAVGSGGAVWIKDIQ